MSLLKKIYELFKTNNVSNYKSNIGLNNQYIPNKTEIPNVRKHNTDKKSAKILINKLSESYDIMDKTSDPVVFFRRLGFSYDCIINLMTYRIRFYKGRAPENQFIQLKEDTEKMVNDMIDRTYAKEIEQACKLKTRKARENRMNKYFSKMEETIKNSKTFWTGWQFSNPYKSIHYDGKLYTENNLNKLHKLKESFLNDISADIEIRT